MQTAELLTVALSLYAVIGVVISVVFLAAGIDRIDPSAHNSYAFRPMLIPGITVLWPVVLCFWFLIEQRQAKLPSRPHAAPAP